MGAYIVVDATPIDSDIVKQYSAYAAPIVEKYKGKFIAKGNIRSLTSGEHHKLKVIIEFPDVEHAHNWYNSEEYQELIQLRDQGMDSVFHIIE